MFVSGPRSSARCHITAYGKSDSFLAYYSILSPTVLAGIFVASNGRFKIAYIDALFVCISAATGTGLTTIDLSSLTAWQQTILVILEITGNQVCTISLLGLFSLK